jgi:hypothetical protein
MTMTRKIIALATSIIVLSAMSGLSYAKTPIHQEAYAAVRSSSPATMQLDTSDAFALMPSDAPQYNIHPYHGGPKAND